MTVLKKFFGALKRTFSAKKTVTVPPPQHIPTDLDREINSLYDIVIDAMGSDRLVLQAGKMDALKFLRSSDPGERILALRRILEENPNAGPPPSKAEIPAEIAKISELMADIIARRQVEDKIDRKVSEKLEHDHQEYVKDIRLQILREEKVDEETPHEIKKREQL